MTNGQAATLRAQIQEAQRLALKIYAKYTREGMRYKQIKAPAQALKANARRVELSQELIRTLNELERVYIEKQKRQQQAQFFTELRKQWEKSGNRFVSFTIYPDRR